jgi:DNA mismatch repair protein MutS
MARPKQSKPASEEVPSEVPAAESPMTPPAATGATPSMAQFLEIKAANPDSILWYRMGDFYELFFEDAVVASAALGIVLTKRGKHLGEDIPMCGVPVVRADDYLQRLIRKGYRVAVCEQLEDPAEARKRGSKAVVKRDVVRLVTPGTLTEDALLDAKTRNYLTAAHPIPGGGYALASLDISTGEFEVGTTSVADFAGEIVRLSPGEVIAVDDTIKDPEFKRWLSVINAAITPVAGPSFDAMNGERTLKERLKVADLGAFGGFSRAELAAIGGLLTYVDLTQLGRQPALRTPRRGGPETTLVIDAASRASLELVRSTSGDKDGSLLGAMDMTVTASGARELAARIASPLKNAAQINARLDAVGYLVEREALRERLRGQLRTAPDIARAISRLSLQRGGPRDLKAVGQGLTAAAVAAKLLRDEAMGLPDDLASIAVRLEGVSPAIAIELAKALVEEPPHLKRDGGFIVEGYREDIDKARNLGADSRKVLAALESTYIEATGVKTLKIRHNNILGYFVEVTQLNAKPLQSPPHDALFRHKQTMANAVRFTTPELIEIEGAIATAGERALALEQEVFTELSRLILADEMALSKAAAALAELDHVCGLGHLAWTEGYVRPEIDDSVSFDIRGGRHPVVEQALRKAKAGPFIENDCTLGRPVTLAPVGFDEQASGRLWLVTGPNMAGKSTFLRQNALIALMAQMGSFVPAKRAHIGVVDRLFSRVGASDDLARGRSTFMVEMVETAAILNQATTKSLVILDEIGRGTATFDGLSIAWAAVEHLHDVNKSRALFATHFHELTQLAGRLGEVANVTVDVKEWHDEIVFLHKIKPGAADRSYGIQVARLAGLPRAVVKRAGEVLARLEKNNRRAGGGGSTLEDLPLFAMSAAKAPADAPQPLKPSPVDALLADIKPDDLSPKAALELIYRLKELVARG